MEELAMLSGKGYLRLKDVLELIPVGKATWWKGCKSGRFPKPYKIGTKITLWKVSDIKDCLKSFIPSNGISADK